MSVLKQFFIFSGAHAVDREYRVMSALHNHNYKVNDDSKNKDAVTFPIPHPLLFCSDASVIGTPFFCYEFVQGRFFKSPQLKSVRSGKPKGNSFYSFSFCFSFCFSFSYMRERTLVQCGGSDAYRIPHPSIIICTVLYCSVV